MSKLSAITHARKAISLLEKLVAEPIKGPMVQESLEEARKELQEALKAISATIDLERGG